MLTVDKGHSRWLHKSRDKLNWDDESKTNSLSHRMSTLLLRGNRSQPTASKLKFFRPGPASQDVIVISDDENDAIIRKGRPPLLQLNLSTEPLFSENPAQTLPPIRPPLELFEAEIKAPNTAGNGILQHDNDMDVILPANTDPVEERPLQLDKIEPKRASVISSSTASSSSASYYSMARLDTSDTTPLHSAEFRTIEEAVPVKSKDGEKKRKRKDVHPPYYDDIKVGVRMYCGPGYEKFPIVLGDDVTHKQVCEAWDAKQARKAQRKLQNRLSLMAMKKRVSTMVTKDANYKSDAENEDPDTSEDDRELWAPSLVEENCLHQILAILPEIDINFAMEKIRSKSEAWTFGSEEVEVLPDVDSIVTEILEAGIYPRQEEQPQIPTDRLTEATGILIEYDKAMSKEPNYLREAIILLADIFDQVPTHYISSVVHLQKTLFYSYVVLENAEASYSAKTSPYRQLKTKRSALEKKYQRSQLEVRDDLQWANLVNELQAAKQYIAREAIHLEIKKEKEDFEIANLEQHRLEHAIVECQCCFDDEIALNRAVSCEGNEMHWFCFGCVKSLAENQVGIMKYEMLCMDGSGCKAQLHNPGVAQAVPSKTLERLRFNHQQSEIAAAGLEGLEQCPFCDFKAICDPIEEESVFRCQNIDCLKATCRRCKKPSHLPRSCEDIEKERGLSARHQVEEARSEAMMRSCPKCKTKIIKEYGCNKMRCTCGTLMCYLCKADISACKDAGYDHFNAKTATCALYDQNGTDRHTDEANEAERIAIEKAKKADQKLDEKYLEIETGNKGKDVNSAKPIVWKNPFPAPPAVQNPPVPPPIQPLPAPNPIRLVRPPMPPELARAPGNQGNALQRRGAVVKPAPAALRAAADALKKKDEAIGNQNAGNDPVIKEDQLRQAARIQANRNELERRRRNSLGPANLDQLDGILGQKAPRPLPYKPNHQRYPRPPTPFG